MSITAPEKQHCGCEGDEDGPGEFDAAHRTTTSFPRSAPAWRMSGVTKPIPDPIQPNW